MKILWKINLNIFRSKVWPAPKFKKFLTVRRAVGPSCQQGDHLGFGRTLGSAGPLPTASGPSFFQWSLAVVAGFLQRCPAILSLNRGRGVSFELSHSTLIHSLPLKLSQILLSCFHWIFAQDLNPRNLSLSFLCCKKGGATHG